MSQAQISSRVKRFQTQVALFLGSSVQILIGFLGCRMHLGEPYMS
jgi:hypothetical protein